MFAKLETQDIQFIPSGESVRRFTIWHDHARETCSLEVSTNLSMPHRLSGMTFEYVLVYNLGMLKGKILANFESKGLWLLIAENCAYIVEGSENRVRALHKLLSHKASDPGTSTVLFEEVVYMLQTQEWNDSDPRPVA